MTPTARALLLFLVAVLLVLTVLGAIIVTNRWLGSVEECDYGGCSPESAY